jgi:gliding motility-associated-like protein
MFKGKLLISILFLPFLALSQANYVSNNIFQTDYFIENRGQFDYQQEGKRKILYSTEMPFGNVFFHKNGFSIKQKKSKPKKIHEQPEYNFAVAELMEKTIHLEWIGANPNCDLINEQKSNHYFSFGPEEYKSYGYKKLTYKNIYPNIDIVYTLEDNNRFHYSILLHKGAKVSDIKMRYNNVDVNLLEGQTSLELLGAVFPVYEFGLKCNKLNQSKDSLTCLYVKEENEIGFKIQGVDLVKEEMEIDPWVATVTSLTGAGSANQKGYDVDYDNDGNLFVYGGGFTDATYPSHPLKIAKYSILGVLEWTFSCSIPSLEFNNEGFQGISNLIVDKSTNKVYTGESINVGTGSKIIRLKANGIYDSFISIGDPLYRECWEFQFNCQSSDIIVMGGSTLSNLTMGTIDKVNGVISTSNISGLSTFQQDVVGSTIDNKGQLYVLLASHFSGTPIVDNKIFKCNTNLTGHDWQKHSGYNSFVEANNKPFLGTNLSNGFNCLSANFKYLFYYDGLNLKAFDLNTGDSVGVPFIIQGYSRKMQGGIESDDCSNVYVGGSNGNIKVYQFDGIKFNYIRDINFAGQAAKAVYDLKVSKNFNKLYVSGDQFIAEVDFNLCDSGLLGVKVKSDCINTAIVNIENFLDGATYDFIWTDTTTKTIVRSKLNTSQRSDTLVGLIGKDYKLTILRNSICIPAKTTKYISFRNDTSKIYSNVRICNGQSYTIGANTYNTPGNYLDTVFLNGCPKVTQTTLSVSPTSRDTIRRLLCRGQSIVINGQTITSSGTYIETNRNQFNCDSALVFIITTSNSPISYTIRNETICSGDTVKIDTNKFTLPGKYLVVFKSGDGCDSTIELNLKVNPSYFFSTKSSVCLGKSVAFYGQNYSRTGLYYKKFQTINGCDSIYELDLRIFRIIGIENYEFCKGDSLKILNRYVKISGDYYDTFKLPSGCDSFHLTKVNVRTWPVQQIDTVLCADDSFIYKNKVYKQATIISDTIFSNYKTSCHKLKFIYLDFKNCDTLNECNRILIPTGFTPNNDGINEKLSLIVKSEKINIVDFVLYNRWGHIVYNYYDDKEGWNGLYKGDDAPVGVYNYSLKYKCKGQNYTKSGNVTLLR